MNHPDYRGEGPKVWIDPKSSPPSTQHASISSTSSNSKEQYGYSSSAPTPLASTEHISHTTAHLAIHSAPHAHPKPASHQEPKAPESKPRDTKPSKLDDKAPSSASPDDLPSPPVLPSFPALPQINLPTSLNQYPAAAQSAILSYVHTKYPGSTSQEVEGILVTLVKAVGEYYLGDVKIVALLSKVLDNANAARKVSDIAWKFVPANQKHQVYGAMAGYYKEAKGFVDE